MSWSLTSTGTPENVLSEVSNTIESSANFGSELHQQRAAAFKSAAEEIISGYGDAEHITVTCYGHIHDESYSKNGESYFDLHITPLSLPEPTE